MRTALLFLSFLIFNLQLPIFNCEVLAADSTPPQTQATLEPEAADGADDWYRSPVTVTLSATDTESGVKSINYRLDGGTWSTASFSGTLNLAPNPSFESVSSGQPQGWVFAGMPSATGVSDGDTAQFGTKSARIDSLENGWSGYSDPVSYIPAVPFANMTASVWTKTQSVAGTGVYFKIHALTPTGAVYLADSPVVTAAPSFTRISKNFSVSSDTAYGIYLDLGIMGTGTAWFDGVQVTAAATDSQTYITYSVPGSHSLEYYSVDNSLNEEIPHKSLSFKIDSTAPTSWRNFGTERQGNDHTLISQITVSDSASGLNTNAGYFQYSLDGGSTWGHKSELLSCSSGWVGGGWWPISDYSPAGNGVTSASITTPAVDYCDSNWQVCKIIRFREADVAGNESSKDICINGAWIKVSGDVGANYNISFDAVGPEDNGDGLVQASGTVTNFATSTGWVVENYSTIIVPGYLELLAQFPGASPLPSGKLPTVSGRYLTNSSFTVSGTTIPAGFGSANFSAVVFVNGDLTINSDLDMSTSSSLLFIVLGDVLVDKNVQVVDGNFIVGGQFDTAYNGNGGKQLVLNGSVAAGLVSFSRSINNNSQSLPSEQILFTPQSLLGLSALVGNSSVGWREVLP